MNKQPEKTEPAFKIVPSDKEFVDKIAALIPLEAADREVLTTMIAGHRLMHVAASPAAGVERELQLQVSKNLNLCRLIWASITKLGGSVSIRDEDIPFDWNLELDPNNSAKTLTVTANRCPKPAAPTDGPDKA